MARTGMVRFGSALVVLTLAGAPTRGAMIRYEFPKAFAIAPAVPRPSGSLSYDGRVDLGGTPGPAPARPGEGFVLGLALGGGSRDLPIGARSLPDGALGDYSLVSLRPLRPSPSSDSGRPWDPADDAPSWWAADDPPPEGAGEPPLALAVLLGVAGWAVHRRCTVRRPSPTGRARLAPPARPTGTAIVLASRPAPAGRSAATRTRRAAPPAVATPLVLPARFVEVSTTARPPALPAWGVGATSLAIRRRAGVRRIPA